MKLLQYFVIVTAATLSLAINPCPLLGPAYPAPRDVSSNDSLAVQAWNRAIVTIENFLTSPAVSNQAADLTFSISASSSRDPATQQKLQYHRTSSSLKDTTVGVREVDGNSVYRVGSISKVFAVYTVLTKLGSRYWQRPIMDFTPELVAASKSSSTDQIDKVE